MMKMNPHKCPVCQKFEFPFKGSFYSCEVCGWEDDPVQLRNPDEECCANQMSLNQAREAYQRLKDTEAWWEVFK